MTYSKYFLLKQCLAKKFSQLFGISSLYLVLKGEIFICPLLTKTPDLSLPNKILNTSSI
jgi:hypothetical protein